MKYKVIETIFEESCNRNPGDIIELSEERAVKLGNAVEPFLLDEETEIEEYKQMEETLPDGIKYKNKMMNQFKKKKK